jgi:F-type H+-transporting ATPase subunit a
VIAESFSFPEINSILRWQDLFSSFNKIALIAVAAAVLGSLVFILAGRKDANAAPASSCRRWARTASAGRRSC